MEKSEAEEIVQKIEEEILKTQEAIAQYREMSKPVAPDIAIGRISRMDAINNKSVQEAALRQAEDKLNKLGFMLTRVCEADFGVCTKCHKPIPLGRLLLMPHSRFCVNCAR